MALSEEAKKQFVDFINLQVYDDKYIDRQEEKKILETAMKIGLGVEDGLTVLRNIAGQKGYVIERDVEDKITEMLAQFAADGKVDKKEFADAVGMYKKASQGKVPDAEIQRRVKKIVIDKGWKAKEGGLFGSKWFSEIV